MKQAEQLNNELGTDTIIWNLGDLYESAESSSFISDSQWCEQEAITIGSTFRGSVAGLNADRLHELVSRLETLDTRIGKLSTFAFLTFTTQVDNEDAGALFQKIQELASRCQKETVFFELEWNTIEQENIVPLLADKRLSGYRHYLETLRRYRPHQLKEIEEQLLIETKTVGRNSWNTLFEKVIGNLRFGTAGRTEEEVLSD
ncbi:MAG: oligoendopeptidase F, partial [Desulfocapsaceae bacterium]|nr:oligoendopeptidase F [Desulfocapsaceae bacterium]